MDTSIRTATAGIIIGEILVAALACRADGTVTTPPIRLQNPRIAVEIDRQTGAIRSIRDKEQDIAYRLSGIGFEVTTDTGSIRAAKAVKVAAKTDGAELRFTGKGLDITLYYRLGANDHFVEKWLTVEAPNSEPYFLKSVALEDITTEAFSEIHFHDDKTIWHCPINLFLRGDKGGCFAGIEYPYWELIQKGKEGFRLGYQPNYQVAKGEVNVGEKYFIGVFRKEGIHRVSQGPYPGRGRFSLISSFGGLKQHFKGGIPNPIKDVPLETLDWGEVWAMKEFMRHVLPNDLTLPEEGYWVWQNGWWAGLWDTKPQILDYLKKAGIHDVMTAHTWYGRGVHPLSPPYIDKMRSKPMGFPLDAGVAGMPGPGAITKGLDHADQSQANVYLDKFKDNEYTPDFVLPPAMDAFHKYGKKIGVHVNSFSIACVYFRDHPEWAAIDEHGKVCQYLFGRRASCFACDEYADHMFAITDHVFKTYEPRWWGWDGRWLSFWEVGAYRPGRKGAGPDPCYAKNHGHPPGDNRYKEWKNVMAFLRKVKERYPKVCLESYYGLHRGGPWALRHLDSAYHYFETHGADMNRLQSWHQQNDRFRPVYKNSLDLFGKNPRSFRFNVIAGLSIASYCMIGQAYPQFGIEENREFFKKWRAWATKHLDYLTVKRDLFDSPGHLPLDGSAHIIKDRGFLFLFRGGFDAGCNQNTALRASIPINRWLKLQENPKALYQVREIYPREGTELGIYRYGEEFLYDMPKDPAVILSLEPAPAGSTPRRPAMRYQPAPRVIPAFSSADLAKKAPAKPRKATYWHWPFDELVENGATTPDASPNKVHARLSGQELCKGVVGKALRFKAGNKGIGIGDLGLQAPATLCFWLKAERSKTDRRILSQLDSRAGQSGCLRLIDGSLQVWNAKGWPVVVDGLGDTDGWQHVAVVYEEDGVVTGYLNGKKSHTANSRFDFQRVKAAIGAPYLGRYGSPFEGALDDFRIYSGALKEKEIKAMCPLEGQKRGERE